MFIKQISVYLENVKGSLCELTQLLGENNINLMAMSIADTSGFGIVRIIVNSAEIDAAVAALRENGYTCKVNCVICIAIPHKPLGLANALKVIEENGLSIEYTYSFCKHTTNDAVIIIRPSDKDLCAKVLSENGITIVSQEEVDAF